ncbi:MAG: hypothetical protein Q7T29_09675 [Gallionella sp.]|nr:hypothetical protein [Gallionella sp.]
MLHEVFGELLADKKLDINLYMSLVTIREIKKGFNEYLMAHVFGKFTVSYRHTSNSVHPTRLTNASGKVLESIDSAGVGTFASTDSRWRDIYRRALYRTKGTYWLSSAARPTIIFTERRSVFEQDIIVVSRKLF